MSLERRLDMYGFRCDECGEVRWSILGRSEEKHIECPACGAQMVEERRRPGRRASDGAERRELVVTAPAR
jgi:putative FmdB family regulatory protein